MSEKPQQIIEFYNSLENLKHLNIWNIQKELETTDKIEGDWKDKVIIERKVLNYNLNNGRLIFNSQITGKNGELLKVDYKIEEFDYLEKRISETSNTWLKSRYSHILWQELKHNKYALIAINNYISTINKIIAEEARELPILLSAILYIAKKTKSGIEPSKEAAISLLNNLPNWFKNSILTVIIENNILETKELQEIAKSIPKWIENENPTSYFHNKYSLETALKLYNKLQKPTNVIYNLLAENEDLILEQHQDDKDFVKITTLGTKARYLRKAGEKEECERVLIEYNRLKQKVKLGKVSVTLDDEKTELFNDFLNAKSEIILKLPTESILAFFSVNEELLVDPIDNEKISNNSIKESIHHLFNTSSFDINTNFKNLNEDEKLKNEIIKNYIISHNIKVYSLFLKVFIDGIISGKLNYYKIYSYLEKHTWFGLKFKRTIAENELDKNVSWLTMLAPGIHNLFSQFELSVLNNTNKINNFILSIDSLTLKFEGALRDFIRLSSGNTTIEKNGNLQEQLLEELLDNSTTRKYFSDRDIELFKFTFTKNGKNLRNNVAHSFMEFSDYSLQVASLVFFCFLRLGKYTFDKKKPAANNA